MPSVHRNLADFWSSKYAKVPKPYQPPSKDNKQTEEALRYVQTQELVAQDDECNIRRVGSEAWHLLAAGDFIEAVNRATDPEFVRAVTLGDDILVHDLIHFLRAAITHSKTQPVHVKESGVVSRLLEFHSFALANFGDLILGPVMYALAATSLPIGSTIGEVTRNWALEQGDLTWSDWVNRPAITDSPLPLITIRESAINPYDPCYREIFVHSSGVEIFVMVGARRDQSRVVTMWDIHTGRRIAKIVLPVEVGDDKGLISFVGRPSRRGTLLAIAGRELDIVEILGNDDDDIEALLKTSVVVDVGEDGAFMTRVVWSKDDRYLVGVITNDESIVTRIQLLDAERLAVVDSFTPSVKVTLSGGCSTHLIFLDLESQTQFYTLSVDDWVKLHEGAGQGVNVDPLQDGLKMEFSLQNLRIGSLADHAEKLLMLLPHPIDSTLSVYDISKYGGKVYTLPSNITVETVQSTALSPDGTTAALVMKNSKEIKFHRLSPTLPQSLRSILGYMESDRDFGVYKGMYNGFVRFSPDGNMLITNGEMGSYQVWDLADGEINVPRKFTGSISVPTLDRPIVPIHRQIHGAIDLVGFVVMEGCGTLSLLNVNGDVVNVVVIVADETLVDLVTGLSAHSSLPMVLVSTVQGGLFLVDLYNGVASPSVRKFMSIKDNIPDHVTCCAFVKSRVPHGENATKFSFATGHINGSVFVWTLRGSTISLATFITLPNAGRIHSLSCSTDGEMIAIMPTQLSYCAIWRWRKPLNRTQPALTALATASDSLSEICPTDPIAIFCPVDSNLVAVSSAHELKLYHLDYERGKMYTLTLYDSLLARVVSMQWSADGNALVCLFDDKKIHVYLKDLESSSDDNDSSADEVTIDDQSTAVENTDNDEDEDEEDLNLPKFKFGWRHYYMFRCPSDIQTGAVSLTTDRRHVIFRDESDEVTILELKGNWRRDLDCMQGSGESDGWESRALSPWSQIVEWLFSDRRPLAPAVGEIVSLLPGVYDGERWNGVFGFDKVITGADVNKVAGDENAGVLLGSFVTFVTTVEFNLSSELDWFGKRFSVNPRGQPYEYRDELAACVD
ncbi:hypothetical protein HDU76_010597 [Blyttiomyces sp. JEL0837]|nr:hypothetical protein HDU76_010597 [Blyttiomyces sp. JEL0837]